MPDGRLIRDKATIARLNAIALPPAYRNAWFCAQDDGHILATGIDERGRKQYRYHPDFRAEREAAKFGACARFGAALPKLRAQVARDLARRTLCRERAIAAVVRLLDLGRVRVGNEDYARTNKSFGATTLRRRHARLTGNRLRLAYTAKSGRRRVLTITDGSLTRFVRRCQDLPGQHLFAWVDDAGEAHPVTSSHVNEYIRAAMGDGFTAKHFRTWGASVIAYELLVASDEPPTLKAMLEPVVAALGNTPAIARKSYVHPLLIDRCRGGAGLNGPQMTLPRATRHLSRAERGLIAFLDACDGACQPTAKAA
ncbi:DNA topoisomerase IB [Sphingomonas sp. FW199]|uniref:DNA topoisomerase IB n=1 Tax=Sphingomonas sp. FW199 TaxID=3400217 RepID=UPI003CF129E8